MIKKIFLLILLVTSIESEALLYPLNGTVRPLDCQEFFSSFNYSHYSTNHFWNKHGNKTPSFNEFKKDSYSLNIGYGISSKDSLGLNTSYCLIKESLNGNSRGFSDIEISWQHLLYNDCNFLYGFQLTGIIPTLKEYKEGITYGKYGFQVKGVVLHRSHLFSYPAFVKADTGFLFYQGFPSDQFVANLSTGFTPLCCLQLISSLDLNFGFLNGKKALHQNIILLNPNYRLLKLTLEAVAEINSHFYLNFGYFHHLWGMNVGTNGGFFAGGSVVF